MTRNPWVTRRTALRSGAVVAGLLGVGTTVGTAHSTGRCYYQIDFVEGPPIDTLGTDRSEFYGQQNRLIQYLHGDESGPIRRDTYINSLDSEVRRCVTAEPIQVNEGTASVEFTVADGCERTFSLGVYLLPGGEFSFETQQALLASATGTFGPGRHELSIDDLPQIICPPPSDPYEQLVKLTGDNRDDADFGWSIAVSDSGDTAIIGAAYARVSKAGSAYVFTRTDGVWTRQAKLAGDNPTDYENFGWSVAISDSGDTVVVSTKSNSAVDISGRAYVFTRTDEVWTQQAKLTANQTTQEDNFGSSVAISDDTVAVGAPRAGPVDSGSTYIYARADGTWIQQAELTADDPRDDGSFGVAVALSNSGHTALISALSEDEPGVYVFNRTDDTWTQQVKFTGDGSENGLWSQSVAISDDIAVAGASFEGNSGAAYVFIRTNETWTQQAKLTPDDAAASDVFGSSVAVSGETIVVGAHSSDVIESQNNGDNTEVSNAGSVYVFVRTDGTWTQQTLLTAADAAARDYFGWSVAISGSGRTVLVGAIDDRDYMGSVYVFGR